LYFKVKQLTNFNLPKLRKLTISENEITTCEAFTGHQNLEILDLSKNKLKDLQGLGNMPKLKELIISENEITR